jgi:putative ABC transport system permease protein
MNSLALALLNIRARPLRNLLLTLIVALATATALTLLVLADSVREGLRTGSDERGTDLTVSQRDAPDVLSGAVPARLEDKLAAMPGVASVSGELAMFAPLEGGKQSVVFGWTANSAFWSKMPLTDGRLPQPADMRPAILGAGVAEALHKKAGDEIDIFGESFRVVGIAGYKSALNRSVIVVRLADLEQLAMRSNQVTWFHLALKREQGGADVGRLTHEIEALGRYVVAPTDQLLRNDRNYEFLQAISRAISVIALLMGSLSVGSALMMAVTERRREIGIMMAIGWSDVRIRTSLVAEGAALGLSGGVLAIPLVLLASLLFRHLPGIGEILSFKLTGPVALSGICAAMLLSAIGALYPAVAATRMSPSQALRTV